MNTIFQEHSTRKAEYSGSVFDSSGFNCLLLHDTELHKKIQNLGHSEIGDQIPYMAELDDLMVLLLKQILTHAANDWVFKQILIIYFAKMICIQLDSSSL